MRIGILGGWDIVRKAYMPLLSSWPGVEIVGIFSRTTQTAQEVAERWHVEFYTNQLDELLEAKPQAAFVLTSNASHYSLCTQLLSAGIDVFVEKPATEHSQQTRELADMAKQQGRIFMVGFNRRYAPLYQQAKAVFGERRVGLCMIEKHRPGVRQRNLRQTYLDDTVHQIDLLRYFTGEPLAIVTRVTLDNEGALIAAASLTTLPGGGTGLVLTSREAGMWQERLTLSGDGLTVVVSAFREMRVLYPDHEVVYGSDRAGKWFPQLLERGFTGEIEHFFKCIQERTDPLSNGYESVQTQLLLESMVDKAIVNE
jgi:virulence factor